MVLSTSHQFLFVHGIKTAGTSIRNMLTPYKRQQENSYLYKGLRRAPFLTEKYPFYDFFHHPHTSLFKAKEIIPQKIYDNLFRFGVIRHPEEWMVSMYKHWQRNAAAKGILKVPQSVKSLEDFILFRLDHYTPLQMLQFIDKEGAVGVHELGNFHNLDRYVEWLSKKLNLDLELPTKNTAPKNQKIGLSIREKTLIEKACHLDFESINFESIDSKRTLEFKSTKKLQESLKSEMKKAGGRNFDPWSFAPSISTNGILNL